MKQFIIQGPTKLKGEVTVSGSKNAALPIIAASCLIKGKVTLSNVPRIQDVITLCSILEDVGAKVEWSKNQLVIDSRNINDTDPDPKKVRNLRASILLIAPLLSRTGKATVPHPGGCLIGSRPIDVHIDSLKKFGAKIDISKDNYLITVNKITATSVTADFSVTGTENIIMTAVCAKGVTKVQLAAAEPHVQDLCHFLVQAGAVIDGIGTHNLTINGTGELKPVQYEIIPDQIEAGTFAIAAAVTKGEVKIHGFVAEHHESLLSKMEKSGINFEILDPKTAFFKPTHTLRPMKIRTEIYPGFPTDLQAPMAVLATQAEGTSEIYETIFEGRLGYINELSKMGGSCIIRDAHQASITGPTPLFGSRITSFDLRAGATLIIAAIIARGESRLDQIEIIDRGYENIESKFNSLGANIKRVSLKEIE